MTRRKLLLELHRDPGPLVGEQNPWLDEDPSLGVCPHGGYDEGRGMANIQFYKPRLLGSKIQAIGRWDSDPEVRNANFVAEISVDDWDIDAKFRRVDFTITGLKE
jgi:hypothetical protein